MKNLTLLCTILLLFSTHDLVGQRKKKDRKSPVTTTKPVDLSKKLKAIKFRNIGPSRGGRSVAGAGVPSDPLLYYMGGTGGGIWKTQDAGISWKNISDGQLKTGSVGAIAVAASDPNVIYAGMGEHAVRGVMTSFGDGVYKSMDAGKTWHHMGLEKSRHIAEIQIHPSNPDLVYVAVQGAVHGPHKERGVYRSADGGTNWKLILHVDENTGAADLSMDINNPRILYAGMWDHIRHPWQVRSGGPGSGIYKSTDGGDNWDQLKKGLPDLQGKVAVDVSPANSEVVYANIEAEGELGGVYRSNDAGKSWKQTSKDRVTVARAWYYIEIFADPQNEDQVYVLNAPMLKSIDGGKTFKSISNPHGDQHHMWINPHQTENILLLNDGGACITFNGGSTWSSQQNQPTAQFYRVITDNQFPYNVYGGQQDNSSVIIASQTGGRGIGWKDWIPGPGCESAFLAFDENNPRLVYGGCYQGNIGVLDVETRTSRDIIAYPTVGLGWTPKDMKYRFNWNAPIIADPFDPSIIYHAGNKVLRTDDEGVSWSEISSDLTRNEIGKQDLGGAPFTNEGAGGEIYNTISYLTVSTTEQGVLWAGSDCGLVHKTIDGGKNWINVTPVGLGESLINHIEISPHNSNIVYLSTTKYKFNDMSPAVYKSIDGGQSWTKKISGIEKESFVRVVKEDPEVPGLLYAGTEKGLYVSSTGGDKWQTLQLNLPVCPITDLAIRHNDLIVATSGRSFWILDDLAPIQQGMMDENSELTVVAPSQMTMFPFRSSRTGGMGKNPSAGLDIYYSIPESSDSLQLDMEIKNSSGYVVRRYSSEKDKDFKKFSGGPQAEKTLSKGKGLHKFTWDLSREPLPGVDGVFKIGSYSGGMVGPGQYTISIKQGENVVNTEAEILPDPRIEVSEGLYLEQSKFIAQLEETYVDVLESVVSFRDIKDQISENQKRLKKMEEADKLVSLGDSIVAKIDEWESNLVQKDQKTFQDVINFPNRLNAELTDLIDRAGNYDPRISKGAMDRKSSLLQQWSDLRNEMNSIIDNEIATYNTMYDEMRLPALILAPKKVIKP